MGKMHIGGALLLLLCISQSSVAFEGDYIWDERFKAGLEQARSGQADDQYALGDMYFRGRGTRTDHAQALHWFLLAAEQGHHQAAYKVGYLLLYGEKLKHEPARALDWFRRSALAGHVPAQYELGKLLFSGRAGPRDEARALKWLGKAKAAKYAPAEAEFQQTVSRLIRQETGPQDTIAPR